MVDLPTPRGDRPGSLMVNNGSQRSGFDSRWRHFDFLIRFFLFSFPSFLISSLPVPPSLVMNVTGNQVYRQSCLPSIKTYRQSSLPAINHSFCSLPSTVYRLPSTVYRLPSTIRYCLAWFLRHQDLSRMNVFFYKFSQL